MAITDHIELENAAKNLGLRFLGALPLESPEEDFGRFSRWLAAGYHGGMTYLERYQDIRKDPAKLLLGASQIWIFGMPYGLGDKWPMKNSPPRVAQYARLRDYHRHLKQTLEKLAADFISSSGENYVHRVVVDSAPLLERAFAGQTHNGFVGKNTCFIHPKWGSFLLLGEIVSNYPLKSSPTKKDPIDPAVRSVNGGCGTCQRCQVNCPTGALNKPYQLDARKCLSYWSIEHRGTIPEEFWPWFKYYYFGCDICQLVCPYNRHGLSLERSELRRPLTEDLYEIATMNQQKYVLLFGGTPLTRAKKEGLQRNALIAMAVTHDPRLNQAMAILSASEEADPVIHQTIAQIKSWVS